jgi:hypothetical protein
MSIGRALEEVLAPAQAALFFQALDDLMEDVFQDVADSMNGADFADLSIADYLPSRDRVVYDSLFARRFLSSLLVVGWKLRSPGLHRPACLAEHLALRAIARRAAEYADEPEDARALTAVHEELFNSQALADLFGNDSERTAARAVGAGGLWQVDSWFEPYGPNDHVYPHVDTRDP